jgi:hypothetical protein
MLRLKLRIIFAVNESSVLRTMLFQIKSNLSEFLNNPSVVLKSSSRAQDTSNPWS